MPENTPPENTTPEPVVPETTPLAAEGSAAAPEAEAPAQSAESDAATSGVDEMDAPAKPRRRVRRGLLIGILVPVVVLASVGGWAALNTQYLTDQWAVWNYESTPGVEKYIDESTMTDHAMFLFEASKPRIAADSEFNDICGSNEGGDGVLGCYTLDTKRITLFEIADERLAGLQEAVATHEMLHAAWDRLGSGERARLAILLEAEVDRLDDDEQFQAQLDSYHFGRDKEERNTELHSLIGTEVAGVSSELEEYYAQYFDDRDALVGLYQGANDVLIEIAAAVTALDDELTALDEEITADTARYESGVDSLNADVDAFNARNEAYFYKSQRAFDKDRNALFARGKDLDALFDAIGVKIDDYNAKLEELTKLDAEAAELYGSINVDARSYGL